MSPISFENSFGAVVEGLPTPSVKLNGASLTYFVRFADSSRAVLALDMTRHSGFAQTLLDSQICEELERVSEVPSENLAHWCFECFDGLELAETYITVLPIGRSSVNGLAVFSEAVYCYSDSALGIANVNAMLVHRTYH